MSSTAFDRACSLVESALDGGVRRRIAGEVAGAADRARGLRRLRDALRANLRDWLPGGNALDTLVRDLDARTRRDGFHVLHDWDGKAGGVNAETIPVDVATFLIERDAVVDEPDNTGAAGVAAAILVDYYFLNLLALLSLRMWDEGDADRNLDRLGALLARVQGGDGSGHRFARHAETLLLIATAHYEPEERGYDALLEKVRTLSALHRLQIAKDHAVAMGCHLRFGFEATYGRDVGAMRDDNVADYPWLAFSIDTLLAAFHDGDDSVAEALVNGLTPDAGKFAPQIATHQSALLEAFDAFDPDGHAYSPLAFFFNFSHNVVKGALVDALLRGRPWRASLNDLFTSRPRSASPPDEERATLAKTLMGYARQSPDRIRGRLTPAIVYDPHTGRQAFRIAREKVAGRPGE